MLTSYIKTNCNNSFSARRSGPKYKKKDDSKLSYKDIDRKPVRLLNTIWRQIPALTNKNITNNDLLDIGKEMHKLDKNEEIFSKDQSSTCKFRISEEIDEEHEIELCKELELCWEIDEKEQEEDSYIFDNSSDEVINTSVRVSPDDKKITCDRGVQAFIPQSVTPEIRKWKKTSEEVRNETATGSYRSGISVPNA